MAPARRVCGRLGSKRHRHAGNIGVLKRTSSGGEWRQWTTAAPMRFRDASMSFPLRGAGCSQKRKAGTRDGVNSRDDGTADRKESVTGDEQQATSSRAQAAHHIARASQ